MSMYSTPRASKSGQQSSIHFSNSGSASKSMRMSDLSGSKMNNDDLFSSNIDAQLNSSEFLSQYRATTNEIESTRYTIQNLMTRAYPYTKSSGIDEEQTKLPVTPPRYGNRSPMSSTVGVPRDNGEFFQSTPSKQIL